MNDEERAYADYWFHCKAVTDEKLIFALEQDLAEREVKHNAILNKSDSIYNMPKNIFVANYMRSMIIRLTKFLKGLNHE